MDGFSIGFDPSDLKYNHIRRDNNIKFVSRTFGISWSIFQLFNLKLKIYVILSITHKYLAKRNFSCGLCMIHFAAPQPSKPLFQYGQMCENWYLIAIIKHFSVDALHITYAIWYISVWFRARLSDAEKTYNKRYSNIF